MAKLTQLAEIHNVSVADVRLAVSIRNLGKLVATIRDEEDIHTLLDLLKPVQKRNYELGWEYAITYTDSITQSLEEALEESDVDGMLDVIHGHSDWISQAAADLLEYWPFFQSDHTEHPVFDNPPKTE